MVFGDVLAFFSVVGDLADSQIRVVLIRAEQTDFTRKHRPWSIMDQGSPRRGSESLLILGYEKQ